MPGSRTVPRLRRRSRWLLAAAVALLATAPLAGCAGATPQCAKGDALRQAGHLTQAAAQYGRAAAAGEVGCGDDGARVVTQIRAEVKQDLTRGRAAESSGNVQAAREAYAAAARADVDNPEASGALARVAAAAPVPAPAASPATPAAVQASASPSATQAPVGPISAAAAGIGFWVAVAALVAVGAVVVTAAWVASESRQRVLDLELQVLQLKGELEDARQRAREAGEGVGRLEADTERLRSQVVATGVRVASERVRSDHILDVLGALPPGDVVVAEHYVPASDGHQTEET